MGLIKFCAEELSFPFVWYLHAVSLVWGVSRYLQIRDSDPSRQSLPTPYCEGPKENSWDS
jgi:hypothetical protein